MQHIEILNPGEVAKTDLSILTEATEATPGVAALRRATIGRKDPRAPNALPVLSQTGVKIGYVADGEPIPPYQHTYKLKGA